MGFRDPLEEAVCYLAELKGCAGRATALFRASRKECLSLLKLRPQPPLPPGVLSQGHESSIYTPLTKAAAFISEIPCPERRNLDRGFVELQWAPISPGSFVYPTLHQKNPNFQLGKKGTPLDYRRRKKRRTAVGSAEERVSTAEPGKAQLCGEGAPPEGKLRNRKNFITNKPDVHSETQSERDHSSSTAREQGLTEDECDELTESGFRRWIIRNFCELKEHVLTQCKETKNLERRFNEMLTRMDNLEKNISELMELENTTRELREACTSFNSRIDQAEERISEVEDQLNEIKREGKMTEKRVKRNEQSLQEIWNYVKRPNLRLIGVPECEEENESKLENTLQDIIQENFPNLARQANIQVQEIQRTPQRYSSRRATPRHIIVRFTRVEMKEKMLRAAREKGQVTHKGKPIRLTADLSAETLQTRREWGPTFNILKENNFQPRISYPAKLSFISEGKIKFFANKQVLRDYTTTRPALQELLKEALHMDGNNQYQPFQKHTK
ncbi:LINE-1 retrotransposable element ORF1 protein, partial [Plecturocebus cupreus]